jgi:hypothetical protein
MARRLWCLSQMMKVTLNDKQWMQACLSVSDVGHEIMGVAQAAPSAFLSSGSIVAPLIPAILPGRLAASVIDPAITQALAEWASGQNLSPPFFFRQFSLRTVIWAGCQFANTPALHYFARRYVVGQIYRSILISFRRLWLNAPTLAAADIQTNDGTIHFATVCN